MTPADLAALHARVFTVPRPFTEAEFANMLSVQSVFLCTHPHGFALGREIAGEAELLTLAVDPDHRREGIGGSLLNAFLGTAQMRGATQMFLEVDEVNDAAIALYLQFGFETVGHRPGYYQHPGGEKTDAVVMRYSAR